MKEQINISFTDLDNYDLTLKQLLFINEKILYHYADKDIDKLIHFVEGFMIYFYSIYQLIQKSKEGDGNEA